MTDSLSELSMSRSQSPDHLGRCMHSPLPKAGSGAQESGIEECPTALIPKSHPAYCG